MHIMVLLTVIWVPLLMAGGRPQIACITFLSGVPDSFDLAIIAMLWYIVMHIPFQTLIYTGVPRTDCEGVLLVLVHHLSIHHYSCLFNNIYKYSSISNNSHGYSTPCINIQQSATYKDIQQYSWNNIHRYSIIFIDILGTVLGLQ